MMAVSSYKTIVSNLKMEVPDEIEGKDQPIILVEYSNGHLKSLKNTGLKYNCYKCTTRKSYISKRILAAESSRLCYTGCNFESDLSKITSSVLKVCILNRKTASIKLLDADLFHLKPLLNVPDLVQTKEIRSYVEMSSDLTLTFGSKMKKKTLNSKLKYSSSNTSSSFNFIDEILTDAAIDEKEDINISTENTFSVIPPQNNSAINVDEVYNLYDIISREEYTDLDSEAEIFINAKYEDIDLWKNENKFSTFILQYLKNNIASMTLHKAKLLCYLHYMFCFLKTVYTDWRKKDPVPAVPEPFKQRLINSFTVKRLMPARMKDKVLAHIIVLGLMLNNYVFNGSTISSSAKISGKKLVSVARALGCHVSESRSDDTKIIELKLPLLKFQATPKRRKN